MATLTAGASPSFARRLFTRGTDFFGPEEIGHVFGIEMPVGTVPPIPFTEEELVRARELGQILVLFAPDVTMKMVHDLRGNKTSDNQPLFYDTHWYRVEKFFMSDLVRFGWRLITQEIVPGSRNKNYLEQTDQLVFYLRQVFSGMPLSRDVVEAIDEYSEQKQELEALLRRDWQEAARRLVGLKLNQMFRESPAEALYSLALYEYVNHERLLPSGTCSWTNELSSYGSPVSVGSFNEYGVLVDGANRGSRSGDLGVRFSLSGNPE